MSYIIDMNEANLIKFFFVSGDIRIKCQQTYPHESNCGGLRDSLVPAKLKVVFFKPEFIVGLGASRLVHKTLDWSAGTQSPIQLAPNP